MTPQETIKKIAEMAEAIAWQAGTGSMELAGQLVSILALNPEKIEPFLLGEIDKIDDDFWLHAENGCLSWHTRTGEIMTPEKMREIKAKKAARAEAEYGADK